jgi:photosystem II stability/assembly factor-like uncharacterized protein
VKVRRLYKLVGPLILLILSPPLSSAQHLQDVPSGTTESLRGLSVASSHVVWASGTNGAYLRSLDGGRTWAHSQVPGAEHLDFRDVEAFSADNAFLLSAGPGDQSRIYKTTNGGKAWTLQFTNHDPAGFFDCMAFWDRKRGIVVGDPVNGRFVVLRTDDGGKRWRKITNDLIPAALNGEGAFAASGSCIAVGGKKNVWFATGGTAARVFRSTNAGKSWSVANTPMVQGQDSTGIFSIAFRDRQHGVIAGGDYKNPDRGGANLAFSYDGGLTWKLSQLSPQSYFSSIADNQWCSIAVGTKALALAGNWTTGKWATYTAADFNAARFLSPERAITVGTKGRIAIVDTPRCHITEDTSSISK